MGTPGSPPTRLTAVLDKWVWPTRRPADLSMGPTDLVGDPHDLLKTFQKIPQMILLVVISRLGVQDKTKPRWTPPRADRRDMARCVT
jgi:hypothetical protein